MNLHDLSEQVVAQICEYLTVQEVLCLARVNRTLYQKCQSELVWKQRLLDDFGDCQVIVALMRQAGLSVTLDDDPLLAEASGYASPSAAAMDVDVDGLCAASYPSVLQAKYRMKHQLRYGSNSEAAVRQTERAGEYLDTAHALIQQFQATQELLLLEEATLKLIHVIDCDSDFAPCYQLLAFICYILNALEPASKLLDLCLGLDPTYQPALDLRAEIAPILQEVQGGDGNVPLLVNGKLSAPLRKALEQLFRRYDRDYDGYLNLAELGQFVVATNGGGRPPLGMLRGLWQTFSPECPQGLSLEGFLDFFVQQSLQEPVETRKDLQKHGFDAKALTRLATV